MSTLQARIFLVTFVGLSAGITYNAIYLQKGSHPAPKASDGRGTELRAARTLSNTASIRKSVTQKHTPSKSQSVLAIQLKLA
jgi:hypothetical protein